MAEPVTLREVRPLFERLLARPVVLAVSGGADSMALMHLIADWLDESGCAQAGARAARVMVATVDHGLRAASREEAQFVAHEAGCRSLPHVTLSWQGPKPTTGIQQAARSARYRLLAGSARQGGAEAVSQGHAARDVVTAHHLDDLAETLVLRLARGSGARGLAAMPERGVVPEPRSVRAQQGSVTLLRPLIGIEKARLLATLADRGLAWREDPSNVDKVYERVRLRDAWGTLAALGLDSPALARSARRLARASAALDRTVETVLAAAVAHHDGAFATVDLDVLLAQPEEIALRLLERVLLAHGGQEGPPGLSQVEELLVGFARTGAEASCRTQTLGGCVIQADGAVGRRRVVVARETRGALPVVQVAPGERRVWDLRFAVTAGQALAGPVEVRALGRTDWREHASKAGILPATMPIHAAVALPSLWSDGMLIAVPGFEVVNRPDICALICTEFLGLAV
jgi:tRNA(Ile)-lysidine synthase